MTNYPSIPPSDVPTNAHRTWSAFRQSIWYDNIGRGLLESGEFAALVAAGVRGCTSNPAIFDTAIRGSTDYDVSLRGVLGKGVSREEAYLTLITEDLQRAADILSPVYAASAALDGYVSVEVNPHFAHDAAATVREADQLLQRINRRNLMIKVPATTAGLSAITELTSRGISVNVTLIFSRQRYREVAEAYIRGLEIAAQNGVALARVSSVASFFVSRIDARVDAWLDKQDAQGIGALRGKAAIANARLAYEDFRALYGTPRFLALQEQGARPQRLLWASTGTKDERYRDTIYVEELLESDTVNTVPPATYHAFQSHGHLAPLHAPRFQQAEETLRQLQVHGLDLEQVCNQLLDEGIKSFVDAIERLLNSIEQRRQPAAGAQAE